MSVRIGASSLPSRTVQTPNKTTTEVASRLMGAVEASLAGTSGRLRDVAVYRFDVPAASLDVGVLQSMLRAKYHGDLTVEGEGARSKITVYGPGAIYAYGPNAKKI
jgi:hypothetical protein